MCNVSQLLFFNIKTENETILVAAVNAKVICIGRVKFISGRNIPAHMKEKIISAKLSKKAPNFVDAFNFLAKKPSAISVAPHKKYVMKNCGVSAEMRIKAQERTSLSRVRILMKIKAAALRPLQTVDKTLYKHLKL